jgi:3-methylcrotonyl-CoA carboxylase alpha subunit
MRSHWRDGDRIREVELTPLGGGRFRVAVDGSEFEVHAEPLGAGRWRLAREGSATLVEIGVAGDRRFVRLGALDFVLTRERSGGARRGERGAGGGLESPMPGVVTRVLVAAGDQVTKGQPLVAIEAMKMEHVIRSPGSGRIKSVLTRPGEMVNGGVALVEIESDPPALGA